MSTGGQIDAVPAPGESARGMSLPVAGRVETRSPQEICAAHGSDFMPPSPQDKVAVALNTLGQLPLNARRVSPERGICGWYIWGGEGGTRSRNPGFFQTLQVASLREQCPTLIPFLALAPGWRVRIMPAGPEIKPPHHAAPPANIAVRRIGSTITRPQSARQWLWLSILLHILAVVLFGDTTGGSARRGAMRSLGGPLTVTLQGPADRSADMLALRADTRLSNLQQREMAPPAASISPRPRPLAPKAADEAAATPVMPPVIATEVEKPVTNFVVPLASPEPLTPPEPPAARLPESLPRLDAIAPPPAIVAPAIEREVALPTELIPRLAPLAPVRSERETPATVQVPSRLKAFVAPPIEPEPAAAPVELPRMVPLPAAPPEREISRPAELLPRLAPVAPAAAIETVTPTPVVPRLAQPVPAAAENTNDPPRVTPTTPSTAVPDPVSPALSRPPPGVSDGAGVKGNGLTSRDATAATPAPGGAPRIDLDAVRQRAREISREGSGPRTLLPFNVRPKEESRTKEQQAFDKALKRPDCREAYSSMGLAAVVPLLWDAVSEKGCKW